MTVWSDRHAVSGPDGEFFGVGGSPVGHTVGDAVVVSVLLELPGQGSTVALREAVDGDVIATLQLSFLLGLARRGALRAQIEAPRVRPGGGYYFHHRSHCQHFIGGQGSWRYRRRDVRQQRLRPPESSGAGRPGTRPARLSGILGRLDRFQEHLNEPGCVQKRDRQLAACQRSRTQQAAKIDSPALLRQWSVGEFF